MEHVASIQTNFFLFSLSLSWQCGKDWITQCWHVFFTLLLFSSLWLPKYISEFMANFHSILVGVSFELFYSSFISRTIAVVVSDVNAIGQSGILIFVIYHKIAQRGNIHPVKPNHKICVDGVHKCKYAV